MSRFPLPRNPEHREFIDVYRAIYDFLTEYTAPYLPKERFFRGAQSRMVIPKDNEFCIFHVINTSRIGTNVETFNASQAAEGEDGVSTIKVLYQTGIQVDYYSGDENTARQRAEALSAFCRSGVATLFLENYGVRCAFSDDPRDMASIDETNQFIDRWSITMYVQHWSQIDLRIPWFDSVGVGLKDVDVFYPPQEIPVPGTPVSKVYPVKTEPFRFKEYDPTVPDWAKQPDKPSYTAQEIGALSSGAKVVVEDDDGDENVTLKLEG